MKRTIIFASLLLVAGCNMGKTANLSGVKIFDTKDFRKTGITVRGFCEDQNTDIITYQVFLSNNSETAKSIHYKTHWIKSDGSHDESIVEETWIPLTIEKSTETAIRLRSPSPRIVEFILEIR